MWPRQGKMKKRVLIFAGFLFFLGAEAQGQETVFALLRGDLKNADEYFTTRNFNTALSLYTNVSKKNQVPPAVNLKIAQCYYFLKQYREAVKTYDTYLKTNASLPAKDIYYYAEAQCAMGEYDHAIEYYRRYLEQSPDDELITKKIWRLNNIRFLYEDSLHYAVRRLPLNSQYGELCAVPYRNSLVFMSNRKEIQIVEKIDAALQAPFYRIYHANVLPDTVNSGLPNYSKPSIFSKELNSRFHAGPVAFYQQGKKMVFAATGSDQGTNGNRTLQLYFAEEKQGTWKTTVSYPFNSANYSITDPTISENGTILIFSSDMPGGLGGKDLYRSEFIEGKWTRPVNLGELINTAYDEVFPYFHLYKTLYFSSDGQAGIGGLDIFKAEITPTGFDEVQHTGYPINTHYDEFGVFIDSLNTHGYFSSNRGMEGRNDDLYEFDMDLQTYPLTITGLIRYKEHNWSDSSELKAFSSARLSVIDNLRNVTVHETSADNAGNFSIVVPYFSKYRIKVVGTEHDEHVVSLEIPKHRRLHNIHEIVVVKDAFKSHDNPVVK